VKTVSLTLAIAGVTIAACGGPERSRETAIPDSAASSVQAPGPDADTTRPAGGGTAPPPVAALPFAGAPPTGATQPTDLRGTWALRRIPTLAGTPQLELAVDSMDGDRFRTRVAFYMAGDVGVEPSNFRPEWGTLTGSAARFPVAMRGTGPLFGEIMGLLASADTINVHTYRWGGEDRLAIGRDGAHWVLVRQR
jgi:hypothetical protein